MAHQVVALGPEGRSGFDSRRSPRPCSTCWLVGPPCKRDFAGSIPVRGSIHSPPCGRDVGGCMPVFQTGRAGSTPVARSTALDGGIRHLASDAGLPQFDSGRGAPPHPLGHPGSPCKHMRTCTRLVGGRDPVRGRSAAPPTTTRGGPDGHHHRRGDRCPTSSSASGHPCPAPTATRCSATTATRSPSPTRSGWPPSAGASSSRPTTEAGPAPTAHPHRPDRPEGR